MPAADSAGPRRSSRRAAAPTRPPVPPATPTSSRSGACSRTATGVPVARTLHLSTGVIGTRLPLERVASGLAAIVPTPVRRRRRPGGRGDRPAHDRLGHQDGDDDGRAAGRRRAARDGHGQRHRQGRRHDPSADGDHAVGHPDRCGRRARDPLGPPAAGRRPDLEPALGRRRHQHQRHRVRPRLGASGAAPVRPGTGRRRAWAPPSRRSPATSRASRRPTARVPRRSSRRP